MKRLIIVLLVVALLLPSAMVPIARATEPADELLNNTQLEQPGDENQPELINQEEEPTPEEIPEDEAIPDEQETSAEDNAPAPASDLEGENMPAPAALATSGSWGEGVTWSITDAGVLTISGSGAMKDITWTRPDPYGPEVHDIPWFADGMPALKEVIIEDGITYIGKQNFSPCTTLEKVTIADSVTSMGSMVFAGCDSLTTVEIPAKMTSIPYSSFNDCDNLVSVTGGESVTSIYSIAFLNCPKLESIDLSKVTYIDDAFANCTSLANITLSPNLYYLGRNSFQACPIKEISLPESLNSIEVATFILCDTLEKVTIPNSVTVVKRAAFQLCEKLNNVVIPASVTVIEETAFDACKALTDISIMNPECTITNDYFGDPLAGDDRQSRTVSTLGVPGITTIHGYPGSTAEAYAAANGFTFEAFPESCEYGYHNYSSEITKQVSCTEHGVKTFTCSNCQDSYEEVIPCEGHKLENKTCTVCGGSFIEAGELAEGYRWALSTDGTLTVYAAVAEPGWAIGAPWKAHASSVKKIVLSDAVQGLEAEYGVDAQGNEGIVSVAYPNLTTIVIGAKTASISFYGMETPALSTFEISKENKWYVVEDQVLIRKNYMAEGLGELMYYPATLTATSYKVPEYVIMVQSAALRYATKLESLYLGKELEFFVPETIKPLTNLKDLYIATEEWFLPFGPELTEEAKLGDPAKVTLHGVKGSLTQQIAEKFGYKFVEMTVCDIDGHPSAKLVNAKDATCTQAGYTGDGLCGVCETLLEKGSEIPALGHTWDAGTEKDGNKVYKCATCGETKTQPLPPAEMDVELPADDKTLQDSVLTEEEQARVENGETVDIFLDVTDITDLVSSEEKDKIGQKLGQHKVGFYLDINLFKQIGNDQPVKVKETDGKIKISIKIPAQLLNSDKNVERNYRVIRVHEGVAEVLEGVFDKNNKTFTFETDGFSTYAITYVDVTQEETPKGETPTATTQPDKKPAPATGDRGDMLLWSVLLVVSAAAMVTVCGKKKYM